MAITVRGGVGPATTAHVDAAPAPHLETAYVKIILSRIQQVSVIAVTKDCSESTAQKRAPTVRTGVAMFSVDVSAKMATGAPPALMNAPVVPTLRVPVMALAMVRLEPAHAATTTPGRYATAVIQIGAR